MPAETVASIGSKWLPGLSGLTSLIVIQTEGEGHEGRGSNFRSASPHPEIHKAVTNKKEKGGKNSRITGDKGAHRCWELAAYIYHSTQVVAPLASFSWKGRGRLLDVQKRNPEAFEKSTTEPLNTGKEIG